MKRIFITGIGTGIGKTLVSAIVARALEADYWKPVQAGYAEGTDTDTVQRLRHDGSFPIYPEVYKLKLPVSPHIAAREEDIQIDTGKIAAAMPVIKTPLVIEGAGGLLVPLNEKEFVSDLIRSLNARVILVSRNYLGSINHSLLTAAYCRQKEIDVAGWIFTDEYGGYEQEIASWTGYPVIACIPRLATVNRDILWHQSQLMRDNVLSIL